MAIFKRNGHLKATNADEDVGKGTHHCCDCCGHGTVAIREISPEISQESYHDVELLCVPAMILGYSICT